MSLPPSRPSTGRSCPPTARAGSNPRVAHPRERCLERGKSAARRGALLGQERERERERCVSAADASTNGPVQARKDSRHVRPPRKHVKTTPHVAIRLPLPTSPDKRLKPVL